MSRELWEQKSNDSGSRIAWAEGKEKHTDLLLMAWMARKSV